MSHDLNNKVNSRHSIGSNNTSNEDIVTPFELHISNEYSTQQLEEPTKNEKDDKGSSNSSVRSPYQREPLATDPEIDIPSKESPQDTQTTQSSADFQDNHSSPQDTQSSRSFNARRLFGYVLSSAAQRIQDIDNELTDADVNGGMMSNVGHIKLKPDPSSTLKVAGSLGNTTVIDEKNLEAATGPDDEPQSGQQQRPGLLSHYLQLMHIDRGRGSGSHRHNLSNSAQTGYTMEGKNRHMHDNNCNPSDTHMPAGDGLWLDIDEQRGHQINNTSSGLRRRRPFLSQRRSTLRVWRRAIHTRNMHSASSSQQNTPPISDSRNIAAAAAAAAASVEASGFFSSLSKIYNRSSSRTSPILGTPLAGTPGAPFRHLSEALPFASSHRQMASACVTPLAQTRRPSLTSLTGDVSTVPGLTIDNMPFEESFLADLREGRAGEQRQNIVQAIDMLLLHQRFLVLVSKALMMYGSPLHHLEDNLTRIAHLLDLEMTASAIPGLVLLSFDDSVTHTSETKLIRCSNGWDMHRLDQTNHLVRRLVHGKIDVKSAVPDLEQIMTAPPIYKWYWQVLNWGVIAWSLCLVCFGGSWEDSGISLALGLIVGLMNLAAGKFSGYTNFFEVSASIISGILSAALANWGCFGATSLSATVVLLPGLVMTTGVIELSSRHMLAGTVRIFYALLLAFIIAYGLLIGVEIYNKLAGNPALDNALLDLSQCQALTKWSWFGTFPLGIISISVLVNIHWRHWASVTVIAGICYGIFWLFKFHLGLDDLAPVVASFALGLVANVWSKFTGQTAYMILLPGEMFLVPGSVGVRGFSSLLSKQGVQGAQLALQMITTCLSIMMGLFASSFVVYPRGKRHSAMLTV
ncbi:pheromone-regulated protein prm10 [Coemansia sp. Benny D115]|nr:pheromone-regulated protein prm10 [Coemansia sp. Benny D115]